MNRLKPIIGQIDTLVYGAKDQQHNEAVILQRLLAAK